MKFSLKYVTIEYVLFVFSILVLTNSYFFWGFKFIASFICLLSLMLLFFINLKRYKRISCADVCLWSYLLALYLYISLPGTKGLFVFQVLNIAGGLSLLSFTSARLVSFGDNFFKVLSILLIPSLICYVFILIDIKLPYTVVYADSGVKAMNSESYRFYFGAVFLEHLIYPVMGLFISRLQGIFDEPGFLGTFCALYLCANKLKVRSVTASILFVCGLLSLSLAFYVIIITYFFAKSILNLKVANIFRVTLLFTVLIVSIPQSYLSELPLISRVYNNIDNIESIDNRSEPVFERAFQEFVDGEQLTFYLGLGNAAHTQLGVGVSSIKSLFYNYGFIGVLGILFLYVMFIFQRLYETKVCDNKTLIAFVFVFLLSAYQRPDLLSPSYLFIFLYGISKACSSSNIKSKNIEV